MEGIKIHMCVFHTATCQTATCQTAAFTYRVSEASFRVAALAPLIDSRLLFGGGVRTVGEGGGPAAAPFNALFTALLSLLAAA